jgi:hypothetical protein
MDITNHINVDRTLKELGVDIFKLKPNSEKRVFKICEICKKEELKKYRYIAALKQTKCINCSNALNGRNNKDKISATNKKYFETHIHPRLGVKHTEETRKKIVENRKPYTATEETRRKLSEANSGTRNGFYGKKHSEKTLEKMRQNGIKNARRGSDCNFYGKTYYAKVVEYQRKDGKTIKLKSNWEVKFAQYLDSNNINWEYEKQSFPITYEYEGKIKNGTYIPDFFLDNEVIEVKGYWHKDARVKFDTFKIQYPQIKIRLLEKKQLRELGISL